MCMDICEHKPISLYGHYSNPNHLLESRHTYGSKLVHVALCLYPMTVSDCRGWFTLGRYICLQLSTEIYARCVLIKGHSFITIFITIEIRINNVCVLIVH